jgi:CRP-like cAMP-binding protein
MPSIIDDIFETKQGKLKDHAIGKLTTYLIDHVEMFKDYPIKAIEEIASRLDNRVYDYKDLISKQGEASSEVMIIYHGEIGLYKEPDLSESVGNLLENSVIGTDEITQSYTVIAHSPRVKVLVLHKMFLKDTLFYV